MSERDPIRLHNIGGGAATEMFDDALEEVLDDIADQNTVATSPRVIKLEFKFKPDADRHVSELEIFKVVTKGKKKPLKTRAFMGLNADGNPTAFEYNPRQRSMFDKKQLESLRAKKPTIKVVNAE